MNDIEKKAQALLNEVCAEMGYSEQARPISRGYFLDEALCRAVEQHEAFRQEVSDAAVEYNERGAQSGWLGFDRFIIAKPDPLVEVFKEVDTGNGWDDEHDYADQIRKAIAKRGGKIVWED